MSCHLIFSICVLGVLRSVGLDMLSLWFTHVALPLAYILLGFFLVKPNTGWKKKLLYVSIVSIVGLVVWTVCFYLYMNDNREVRYMPSEIYWLYYGMYNPFAFIIPANDALAGYLNSVINKNLLSFVMLLTNFCPMLFMWVGAMVRQITGRMRRVNL